MEWEWGLRTEEGMVVAVVAQEVLDIPYYRFPETVKSKLDEKERIYVDCLIDVCCDVSMKSRTDVLIFELLPSFISEAPILPPLPHTISITRPR